MRVAIFAALCFACGDAGLAWAAPTGEIGTAGKPNDSDVIAGPFSDYGEFDTGDDEANDEKFFQFGRFFGVGIATGLTTAAGNAGRIYQGGFPTIGFKLAYWFDFSFALQLALENSSHNYNLGKDGLTDVNLFRLMLQLKYYIDTRDLAAPITFVGPHLIFGAGTYSRTDNVGSGGVDASVKELVSKNAIGFNFGGGLELTLKPKRTLVQIEGLAHFVPFDDNNDSRFSQSAGIPDRTGPWLSATIGVMFTW